MKLYKCKLYKCSATNRKWININHGWLAIAFGKKYILERIWFKNKLIIADNKLWRNKK